MKVGKKNNSLNVDLLADQGFSLVEVLIAVISFAAFMAAFSLTQGRGLTDSERMKEEVSLHSLAESKLTEIILDPPKFRKSLALSAETKPFEEDQYENYEFTTEYREFELPDLEALVDIATGGSGDDEEGSEQQEQQKAIKKRIFKRIQKNLEKIIWQVILTVRNKQTGEEYSLSAWLENSNAKIEVGL